MNIDFFLNNDIDFYIGRLAFVFLIFSILTSGYINQVIPNEIKQEIKKSYFLKNIIGIIMIFSFIMLEGGWSFFDDSKFKLKNNWASGNAIHSFIFALIIYFIFLLSVNLKLNNYYLFFSGCFILYFINTQRSFWKARNLISKDVNNNFLYIELFIFIFVIFILFYDNVKRIF